MLHAQTTAHAFNTEHTRKTTSPTCGKYPYPYATLIEGRLRYVEHCII
ncbi:hypothetical protein F442_16063 [Phytophthora nicotianae P10297]|uniref:Uncharacterized protein n=3 Tax=Phytophthora nicotianae TaxID=4792 RepID=W2PTH9_PHYN3|nr:hypothetical protein PPTG_23796 [Phytophthora nicotianae INRA-310]ETM37973.1 hypothetical protein L914_15619 [Phytophthora nicotianae]ETN03539.1 hypothetical protein PPTG_23796 [Phytophthora nicotianae INRA-310]ETP35875.1 hypothetical protein F442_16063 [Phytophthora nicotianae P10297]